MAVEIKLPVLGEGVDSGTVAGVLAAVGDSVEADAPLIELETDKAVIEVPATEAGVIASACSVHVGDTVAVGQVIATIEPGAEPGAETAGPSSAPAGEPAAEPPTSAPSAPASVPPAVATAPQPRFRLRPGRRLPLRRRHRRALPGRRVQLSRSGRSGHPKHAPFSRASSASTSPRCRAPATADASCPATWCAPRASLLESGRYRRRWRPRSAARCRTSAAGARWSASR